MKSSSAYTNYVRVKTEATLLKVEFPGNVARNVFPLQAATACPQVLFGNITYTNIAKCFKQLGNVPCTK